MQDIFDLRVKTEIADTSSPYYVDFVDSTKVAQPPIARFPAPMLLQQTTGQHIFVRRNLDFTTGPSSP